MNKNKRIMLIVLTIVVIILIVLSIISHKNYDKRIDRYVSNLGFKLEDGLYYKQLSIYDLDYYYNLEDTKNVSFKGLYFNRDTYNLIYDNFESKDGVKLYFIGNYDYKDDSLTYTYRIVSGGSNAIFDGSYDRDNEKLICDSELSYDTDLFSDDVCVVIQDNIDDFINEINYFIINGNILEYMRNKNK